MVHIDNSTNVQYNMLANYKYGIIVWMKNSVDPDQLASSEAS